MEKKRASARASGEVRMFMWEGSQRHTVSKPRAQCLAARSTTAVPSPNTWRWRRPWLGGDAGSRDCGASNGLTLPKKRLGGDGRRSGAQEGRIEVRRGLHLASAACAGDLPHWSHGVRADRRQGPGGMACRRSGTAKRRRRGRVAHASLCLHCLFVASALMDQRPASGAARRPLTNAD